MADETNTAGAIKRKAVFRITKAEARVAFLIHINSKEGADLVSGQSSVLCRNNLKGDVSGVTFSFEIMSDGTHRRWFFSEAEGLVILRNYLLLKGEDVPDGKVAIWGFDYSGNGRIRRREIFYVVY